MQTEPRRLAVGPEAAGERLDRFLAERLALSRAQVRRLLARGAVRIEGPRGEPQPVGAKGLALEAGQRVWVEPFRPPHEAEAPVEAEAALSVLAEGPGWLALDKPAGVAVHPYRDDERGTLLSAALARHPEMQGVGEGGLRSGVVHRLDLDTSGVLLMATEQSRWLELREAFEQRRVDKRYWALVAGRAEREGSARSWLSVARHRPARVRVLEPGVWEQDRGARETVTHWKPLEVYADTSWLEVRIETGFLHQIRAVLASRGFPVLGDRVYAPPAVAARAPRQMLHARSLRCGAIAAESPEPADFRAVREALAAGWRERW